MIRRATLPLSARIAASCVLSAQPLIDQPVTSAGLIVMASPLGAILRSSWTSTSRSGVMPTAHIEPLNVDCRVA